MIIGAGGHGRVVADALRTAGHELIGFADSDPATHGRVIDGVEVLGDDSVLSGFDPSFTQLAIGVGSVGRQSTRRRIAESFLGKGWRLVTVVHASALVAPSVQLGAGAQVMAGAIVQPGARIGAGSIINTGAVVDHDCIVGAWCHVAPGATLSGGVVLGDECHVGAASVVIQGCSLDACTTVGAGAVVINDSVGGGTLIGVPARRRDGT